MRLKYDLCGLLGSVAGSVVLSYKKGRGEDGAEGGIGVRR